MTSISTGCGRVVSVTRFKSRIDGLARRKGCYGCMVCGTTYPSKEAALEGCGHGAETYLASKKEAERFRQLHMLQRVRNISGLECQPKFDLMVNGFSVGSYKADFRYRDQDGREVIEDVKSRGSDDGLSKLKRRLVFAIYGKEIKTS